MKKQAVTLSVGFIMFISALGYLAFTSNSKLNWYKFDDGMAKAKKEKKLILVDFYTDWCGYCKKMDAETYSNENVIKYLNEKFVLIKLNPEKDGNLTFKGTSYSAQEFTRGLGISGYPSTLFIEPNETLITIVPGYIKTDEFLNIIEFIGEKAYNNQKYDDFLKNRKTR